MSEDMNQASTRVLLVVRPDGDALRDVVSWVPAGCHVRIATPAEAPALARDADVVLLPPDVDADTARHVRDVRPGRTLLWTRRPEPGLEARAADLALAGTLP